jgi:hypothetical protein
MTHAAATRRRGQKGKEGGGETKGARRHAPSPTNGRGPHYGGGPLHTLAGPVQMQLKVGPVDDPYEREANAVAQRAASGAPVAAAAPLPPPEMAQRQTMEDKGVQPLLIRRQVAPEEEPVQRQTAPEDEPVQRQTMPEEEAVQRQTAPEDEPVQRQAMPEEEPVQRQAAPEEAPIQRAANGNGHVSGGTAATIGSPGAGQPMAPGVRRRIEPHVGADLSGVRVHSGARAGQAAASLGARAFTHRQHIFLGRQESSSDVQLMAHEATHVVQQGATANTPDVQPLLGIVGEFLNDYAQQVPGYTLFTVIIGYNPLLSVRVERNATNLVQGLLGLLGPIGNYIFAKLQEYNVLQPAFDWVGGQLNRLDLSLSRIQRTIEAAYDEASITYSFGRNLGIVRRHFGRLYDDVVTFVRTLVDHIMAMIKEAAIAVAEGFLAENRAWDLIKKILGHDPLRDVPVMATPVEILSDFLLLIGKEEELRQMQARGTLEETANWLATQIGTFMSLLGELRGLITSAWEAIQPENLPNLATNLRDLATRVGGFLQRVWDFAITVAAEVLALIKKSLLAWLSEFVHQVPGFHLVTVIIRRNPFTGEAVPRTPENIIRGFITLLPGGNAIYERLAESGTIAEAGARIEGAMAELGISWPFVVGLFTGIWDSLSINDLIDPVGAFTRIRDQFGEPISRLFAFINVVLREMVTIILEMMNFPSELLGSIISNAVQAIGDIRRDPVGFILNMLQAVKAGFTNFFNNILTHLVGGLADWLFRGLRDAGIEPPTDLSLASILNLVLQVLGLTMDRIWEKLAERIGQEAVDRIRGAIERLTGIWNFVRDVQERGVVAIWEYLESQISNLWNIIMEQAQSWIMERIINRAIQWLLSLLDPTGIMPVINSFIAFFRAVQSAIEYLRDILAIINDYVTTIASIARGAIDAGAQKLEQGLANAIPISIGFLANQFGLGNIGEKVQEIIAGIRALIDQALDWLLDRAVSMGQAVLGMLGFGGAEESDGAQAPDEDSAEFIYERVEGGHTIRVRRDLQVFRFSEPVHLTGNESQEELQEILESIVAIQRPTYPVDTLGRAQGAAGHVEGVKAGEGRETLPPIASLPGGLAAYQPGDARGHLIGDRFYGEPVNGNLVPMHISLNNSTFKTYENSVATGHKNEVDAGRPALVHMSVTPNYPKDDGADPASFRPSTVDAVAKIITLNATTTGLETAERTVPGGSGLVNPSAAVSSFGINTADETTMKAVLRPMNRDKQMIIDLILELRPFDSPDDFIDAVMLRIERSATVDDDRRARIFDALASLQRRFLPE